MASTSAFSRASKPASTARAACRSARSCATRWRQRAGPRVDGPALAGQQRRVPSPCPPVAIGSRCDASRLQRRHPEDHVADPVAQPHDQWPWLHSGADNRHPSILPPDPMRACASQRRRGDRAARRLAAHGRLARRASRPRATRRLWLWIQTNHRFNCLLWAEEDLARRTQVGDDRDRGQQTRDRPLQPGAQRCHRACRRAAVDRAGPGRSCIGTHRCAGVDRASPGRG